MTAAVQNPFDPSKGLLFFHGSKEVWEVSYSFADKNFLVNKNPENYFPDLDYTPTTAFMIDDDVYFINGKLVSLFYEK